MFYFSIIVVMESLKSGIFHLKHMSLLTSHISSALVASGHHIDSAVLDLQVGSFPISFDL